MKNVRFVLPVMVFWFSCVSFADDIAGGTVRSAADEPSPFEFSDEPPLEEPPTAEPFVGEPLFFKLPPEPLPEKIPTIEPFIWEPFATNLVLPVVLMMIK